MKTVDTPPFYAAGIGTGVCSTFGGLAHYGIVADWKKALPAFVTTVKSLVS